MTTTTTANNSNENISLKGILESVLEFWYSIRGTKTFVGIMACYAMILLTQFLQDPFSKGILLGAGYATIPYLLKKVIGKYDAISWRIACYTLIGFDVIFIVVISTMIGSFSMAAAGVFPPVAQIAVTMLGTKILVSIPVIASIHWHSKGSSWFAIACSLIAVYTAIIWTVTQFVPV